jgi:hypothetical protein
MRLEHRVQGFTLGAVRIKTELVRFTHLTAPRLLSGDVSRYRRYRLVRDVAARRSPIRHTGSIPCHYTESDYLTERKRGALDFLCPLKGAVPVR